MTGEKFKQIKKEIDKPIQLKYGKPVALVDGLATLLIIVLLLMGKASSNVSFAFGFVILANTLAGNSKNAVVVLAVVAMVSGYSVLSQVFLIQINLRNHQPNRVNFFILASVDAVPVLKNALQGYGIPVFLFSLLGRAGTCCYPQCLNSIPWDAIYCQLCPLIIAAFGCTIFLIVLCCPCLKGDCNLIVPWICTPFLFMAHSIAKCTPAYPFPPVGGEIAL